MVKFFKREKIKEECMSKTKKKTKKGNPKKTKHLDFIDLPNGIVDKIYDKLAKTIPKKKKTRRSA